MHLESQNKIYMLYLDLFKFSMLLKQQIFSHTVSTEDLELSRIAVWKLLCYIVEHVSQMVKASLRHDVICFQWSSFCSLLNTSLPLLTVRLLENPFISQDPNRNSHQNAEHFQPDQRSAVRCTLSCLTEMPVFHTSGCFLYD